jgi:hypothetical protein
MRPTQFKAGKKRVGLQHGKVKVLNFYIFKTIGQSYDVTAIREELQRIFFSIANAPNGIDKMFQ